MHAIQVELNRDLFDAFKRPVRMRSWLPPRLAVVYASGAITEGDSGNDLLMGRLLGEDTLVEALEEAREDGRTKAVVLRIDSPGGSSLASEGIRREIERTRQIKPIIVSMGGVAASGGYWIACGTDRILADPGTITGSIGVYAGKFSAQELLGKIGARTETVSRGRFAGLSSPFRDMSAEERALLLSSAEFSYARFLELVSHARHMPQAKVKDLAGGHVYSGSRALELGLIDREAGLLAAIEEARSAAGVPQDAEVEIAYLPEQRPFLLSDEPLVYFDATAQLRRALASTARWTKASAWLLDPRLVP
jgi:protease-4